MAVAEKHTVRSSTRKQGCRPLGAGSGNGLCGPGGNEEDHDHGRSGGQQVAWWQKGPAKWLEEQRRSGF